MNADDELLVVLCTAPDLVTAEQLAKGLVDARLAACVNAIPGLKSFYRWHGKVEIDSEVQLLIKTSRARFDELAEWIEANHPYEGPEIVAVAAERVSESYLGWALGQTS
ncbi:MAG: divalent-cation tolerance protein CutA [Polyangiales bacterium]